MHANSKPTVILTSDGLRTCLHQVQRTGMKVSNSLAGTPMLAASRRRFLMNTSFSSAALFQSETGVKPSLKRRLLGWLAALLAGFLAVLVFRVVVFLAACLCTLRSLSFDGDRSYVRVYCNGSLVVFDAANEVVA